MTAGTTSRWTPTSRTPLRGLVAVLAGAALLRLVLFHLDGVPFIYSDSGAHLEQAATLVPAHDRPLGYALFLRLVLAARESLHTVVYVQTAMGLLTIAGFVWVAHRYVLKTAAGLLLFATLAAFDLRTVLFERWILAESLSMFLLLPYFLLLFQAAERGRWFTHLLLGAVAACLILVRTVFTFVVPFTLLATALFPPAGGEPRPVRRGRAALLCALGTLPLLLGYAGYARHHTGRFAPTHFDGYALWAVAGDPSVCERRPWDEPRGVVCRNRYAQTGTPDRFRAIWKPAAPAADLYRHYRDPVLVNDALRTLAWESVLYDPIGYLAHMRRFAGALFVRPVSFARHRNDMLQDNGAEQVRRRFGPQHPSVSRHQSTAWGSVAVLMRVSIVYGILLLGATLAWLRPRDRPRAQTLLLLWIWAYVAMVAMFGSSDADRYYVILTVPLLLLLVGMAESCRRSSSNDRKVRPARTASQAAMRAAPCPSRWGCT